MKSNINQNKLDTTLNTYEPRFSETFNERIMDKINAIERNYNTAFNNAFNRIALSGVAAVAILLLSIYITDGSFSTDALVGTSNLDFESLSALTISDF